MVKSYILPILQINIDDLNMLIFEQGCAWVEYRFQYKPVLKNKWTQSPIFWKWWNIQVEVVITEFLEDYYGEDPLLFEMDNKDRILNLKSRFLSSKKFPAGPIVKKIFSTNKNTIK